MAAPAQDALRLKLEDNAELLERARSRYSQLRGLMRSLRWKTHLQRNGELLHQIAQAEADLQPVLLRALHRCEAEAWPAESPIRRCLQEVAALRDELLPLTRRRLRRGPSHETFSELLVALEAAITGPRTVLPGQKWATAGEVLPESLPQLQRLATQGRALEQLFKRPIDPRGSFPWTATEAEQIRHCLPAADEAVQEIWRRVHRCDPSGGVLRLLQRRSRRAPMSRPRTGPEQLLFAVFWLELARSRLREVIDERFRPAVVSDLELGEVLLWLAQHEASSSARLPASARLSDPRAGLLELAFELRVLQEVDAVSRGRPAQRTSEAQWERVLERARRADAGPAPEDAERVRGALDLMARTRQLTRSRVSPSPTPARGVASLETLVRRARDLSESPQVPPKS